MHLADKSKVPDLYLCLQIIIRLVFLHLKVALGMRPSIGDVEHALHEMEFSTQRYGPVPHYNFDVTPLLDKGRRVIDDNEESEVP